MSDNTIWFRMALQAPSSEVKDLGKEYNVTVYCKHWKPTVQTKTMSWNKVIVKGKETYGWFWNGRSCISTWEVTDWAYFPEPAWIEE